MVQPFLPWLNDGPTDHEGMFILEGFSIAILEYLGISWITGDSGG